MNAVTYSPISGPADGLATRTSGNPRPLVILNPRSFRASIGNLAESVRTVARSRGIEVIETSDPRQIAKAVDAAMASGESLLLAVVAGDGTVQALTEHLARIGDPQRRPPVLLLAGGRTNLIAADFGGRGQVARKLGSLFERVAGRTKPVIQERHMLVIEQPPAPPRYGFFVAGAQVDSAIRACHAHRDSGSTFLHTGHVSSAWCLLKLALARAMGRNSLPPRPTLNLAAEGLGNLSASVRLLAASTLEYKKGLLSPFADRGHGILRMTAVSGDASGFWWRLPSVLTGHFTAHMTPESGYLSGRCERLEVRGLARYTLDGEKFEVDATRPVIIGLGPALRFVVP